MKGCNQENWLLTIGVMCLLDLFRRVGEGGGSWILRDYGWEVETQKKG